ncbi:MAG TPA: trypsin-like peptidase domain-containing protein, partial [Pseudomonadota bacterium]|nr:trypsin-like peptidase domain-containing protein [Pseudomonadota bacterium]
VVEASTGTVQVYMYNPKERTLETSLRDYVKNHSPLIGRVTKRGKDIDLALVRLPELVSSYPTVQLGNSDELRIGQDVVAIGNPHGLTWTFTSGTISAIRKDALQTETPINPGNSGGPLLDMHGQMVGVNTFIRKESQGLGFAIPANTVKEFVDKFSKLTEIEGPAAPAGPTLSKNPVPLASLSLSQDLDRLRNLNGRRGNKQAEQMVMRDIEAADLLRQRMVRGELTVAQMLPQMLEQLKQMAMHNRAVEEGGEAPQAFQQQLEKTAEHLKQIFQVSQ